MSPALRGLSLHTWPPEPGTSPHLTYPGQPGASPGRGRRAPGGTRGPPSPFLLTPAPHTSPGSQSCDLSCSSEHPPACPVASGRDHTYSSAHCLIPQGTAGQGPPCPVLLVPVPFGTGPQQKHRLGPWCQDRQVSPTRGHEPAPGTAVTGHLVAVQPPGLSHHQPVPAPPAAIPEEAGAWTCPAQMNGWHPPRVGQGHGEGTPHTDTPEERSS